MVSSHLIYKLLTNCSWRDSFTFKIYYRDYTINLIWSVGLFIRWNGTWEREWGCLYTHTHRVDLWPRRSLGREERRKSQDFFPPLRTAPFNVAAHARHEQASKQNLATRYRLGDTRCLYIKEKDEGAGREQETLAIDPASKARCCSLLRKSTMEKVKCSFNS